MSNARKKLNIDLHKKIILFVAQGGVSDPRKGYNYLSKISQKYLSNDEYHFIVIGETGLSKLKKNVTYIPYLSKSTSLSWYYAAADVLLFPSLAENCPLVLIEAMSCGIPIVAFNTGGIPEIIKHKKNGYIAQYQDEDDLEFGLNWILSLSPKQLKVIKDNNRSRAVRLFSQQTMVDKYERLYTKKIKNEKNKNQNPRQ